jgi:preprotein translocase subunit SecG
MEQLLWECSTILHVRIFLSEDQSANITSSCDYNKNWFTKSVFDSAHKAATMLPRIRPRVIFLLHVITIVMCYCCCILLLLDLEYFWKPGNGYSCKQGLTTIFSLANMLMMKIVKNISKLFWWMFDDLLNTMTVEVHDMIWECWMWLWWGRCICLSS